jgi:hypothetical protein
MSKQTNFSPVTAVKLYESDFSDEYNFVYVHQKTETVYTSGADATYAGKKKNYSSSRNCFTKWAKDKTIEQFNKEVLKGRGAGRIISIIGCDLYAVLTDDQLSYLRNIQREGDTESAEELIAHWSEKMVKLNPESGEIIEYRGHEVFGRYYYGLDDNAADIDMRDADVDRIEAKLELERFRPARDLSTVAVPEAPSLVDTLGF